MFWELGFIVVSSKRENANTRYLAIASNCIEVLEIRLLRLTPATWLGEECPPEVWKSENAKV